MSIFQFFRILWAYRLIVIGLTVVSFTLMLAFVQIAKPQYEAQSRVMLDIVKPDPVTGQVIASPFVRAYTKTQIELVQDYGVAGAAVDALNWVNNPNMQRLYRESDDRRGLDFRQWAAQVIVDGTSARLIEGSNILEITYTSQSPAQARNVSEALRKAYVDQALRSRQETARRNAEWYEDQAEKAKGMLLSSEQAKANYERETGIVLQDGTTDLESARLAALAQQGAAPIMSAPAAGGSPAELQMTQVDAEIAQASRTLGPNHPQLLELRQKRDLLAAQVARDRSAGSSAAAAAASAARATSGLLEAQKARVMAQREQVERLRLLQADVELRRQQYNQAATRAAQLRQEAEIAVTGVTPLGAAVTPQAPVFPNKPLFLGASLPVGAGLGLVFALLMEFVGRRVRGVQDMTQVVQAPVLGVIRPDRAPRRNWRKVGIPKGLRGVPRPQSAGA
ncbi:MAG: hypothetical protein U1C74_28735 [Phenylobacterium sp.]|nr:hypothetical protein [Phenylobacterium sp.]